MGIDARIYVRTERKFTDEEIVRLSYDVALAFGHGKFLRSDGAKDRETGEVFWGPHHNIERIAKIEQDGPDVEPKVGETFLEVHVFTRYYGPGYERGDLPFLIALAEWLDRRIPGCTVLYGGDSSGVCAGVFGPKQRAALLDHFASDHGRDYYGYFDKNMDGAKGRPMCTRCHVPMTQYSWGPGPLNGKFNCHGCGAKLKSADGGETFAGLTGAEVAADA